MRFCHLVRRWKTIYMSKLSFSSRSCHAIAYHIRGWLLVLSKHSTLRDSSNMLHFTFISDESRYVDCNSVYIISNVKMCTNAHYLSAIPNINLDLCAHYTNNTALFKYFPLAYTIFFVDSTLQRAYFIISSDNLPHVSCLDVTRPNTT